MTFCVVEFSYFGLYNMLCMEGLRSTWGISSGEDKLGARDRIPPPCRSPPLVVLQGGGGLAQGPGGEGDRHLVNPKFFVAAHCVVVWVNVLWGTATCIPCTHGRTFCSLSLKWDLIAQEQCADRSRAGPELAAGWARLVEPFHVWPAGVLCL